MAIDFGTVLDAVNTDNLFCGINPIKDAIIAHAELAESGQIFRHTDEPAMNHASALSASHWILRSTPAPIAVSSPAS